MSLCAIKGFTTSFKGLTWEFFYLQDRVERYHTHSCMPSQSMHITSRVQRGLCRVISFGGVWHINNINILQVCVMWPWGPRHSFRGKVNFLEEFGLLNGLPCQLFQKLLPSFNMSRCYQAMLQHHVMCMQGSVTMHIHQGLPQHKSSPHNAKVPQARALLSPQVVSMGFSRSSFT